MNMVDQNRLVAWLLTVLVVSVIGCSESSIAPQPLNKSTTLNASQVSNPTIVTISVAASTADVVKQLAAQFESETGTVVQVNSGSSNGLATQIIAGAPVDLFLSASVKWADAVRDAGLAVGQTRLLTNTLVLVVPEDNPANVQTPHDLLSDRVVKLALAGEQVPAGTYADQALTKLELLESLASSNRIVRGQDVRGTLSFVERGEAEAGIVYSTDAAAVSGVKVVHEFDPSLHDEIVYVLVLLKSEPQNPAAVQFYEFLTSPKADVVNSQFGFQRAAEPKDSSGVRQEK